MALVEFFDKDIGVSLAFTLVSGSTAVDLSGFTVTLIVGKTKQIPLTVLSAASGVCGFTTSAQSFPAPGDYRCQILRSGFSARIHTSAFVISIAKSLDYV